MVKLILGCLLAFALPNSHLLAQSAWNLKKDKDDIRIYCRTGKDSKFNEMKVVFDLPGTLTQLHNILADVSQYKNWVYSTIATKLIENRNDSAIIYYSRISAPWPLSNRDFYSDTHIRMDSLNNQMRISSRNITNRPLSDDHLVRIPYLKAEWTVTVPAAGVLHVEYMLSWDPGGNIPAWVANMFCTSGPFQSFSQLRRKMSLMSPHTVANK